MTIKCLVHFITCFFTLIIFSACSNQPRQALFVTRQPRADSSKTSFPVYRIQPQDVLQIRNLQNLQYMAPAAKKEDAKTDAMTENSYQVEEDGTLALPVIGRVKVAGLTRLQAALMIEDQYKKQLLKDPIIDVRIANLKVTVFGEVSNQGNYPLTKDNISLTDILGEAGGLTENADEKQIKIIRGDRKNPEIIYADLNNVSTLADPRLTLQNNDIIYVMQNKKATRKENLQNVNTWLQPALVLLNTALVIYSLGK